MATVLSIIKQFCYRINVPAPTAVVSSTSPAEQQYLSIFRYIGDYLRNMPVLWPQLKRGYTFTTTTDERRYELPGDFYKLLESTQWDVTNNWPMRGPISDYNYSIREFAIVSLQTRKAYRLIGPTNYLFSTSPYSQRSQGSFQIDPAGQNNTDQLFLGYISCNYVWPRDWVTNTVYSAGDIRAGNGYVYRTALGGTSGANRPDWSTGSDSDGTVTWTVYTEPYLASPDNAALNDSDICLFDEDIMIDGMVWRYNQAKGREFQAQRVDWENSVKNAIARFNGPQRISMCDELKDYFDWPNIPQGSWNV